MSSISNVYIWYPLEEEKEVFLYINPNNMRKKVKK